jgi:hypothetical protein
MLRIEYNPSSSRSHRPSSLKSLQLDITNHRKAKVSAVSGSESKGRSTDAGVLISMTDLPKRMVLLLHLPFSFNVTNSSDDLLVGVVLTDMVKVDWTGALDGPLKLTTSLSFWVIDMLRSSEHNTLIFRMNGLID